MTSLGFISWSIASTELIPCLFIDLSWFCVSGGTGNSNNEADWASTCPWTVWRLWKQKILVSCLGLSKGPHVSQSLLMVGIGSIKQTDHQLWQTDWWSVNNRFGYGRDHKGVYPWPRHTWVPGLEIFLELGPMWQGSLVLSRWDIFQTDYFPIISRFATTDDRFELWNDSHH